MVSARSFCASLDLHGTPMVKCAVRFSGIRRLNLDNGREKKRERERGRKGESTKEEEERPGEDELQEVAT